MENQKKIMTDLEAINNIENGCNDDFENELSGREIWIASFQQLVNSGTIHHLQGYYQRTAARLIQDGEVLPP